MKHNLKIAPAASGTLRVAVDIGGTFTDGVAALSPAGRIWVAKAPTTPADPGEAVSTVILSLLRQAAASMGAPAPKPAEVVHGTTLITNTLIERSGARTGLITTRGMRDALDIGREWRYDIYDLEIVLPQPLVAPDCRVEVDERLNARGEVITPLEAPELERMTQAIAALGLDSVAVSLLHSYVNDAHEKQIRDALRAAMPDLAVSISSELAREINAARRCPMCGPVATSCCDCLVGPRSNRCCS